MAKKEVFTAIVERVPQGVRITAKGAEVVRKLRESMGLALVGERYLVGADSDPVINPFRAEETVRSILAELTHVRVISENLTPRWDSNHVYTLDGSQLNLAAFFCAELATGYEWILSTPATDAILEALSAALEGFARAVWQRAQPFRTEIRLTVADVGGAP